MKTTTSRHASQGRGCSHKGIVVRVDGFPWLSRRIRSKHGNHFPHQGTMMADMVRAPCFAMMFGGAVDTSGSTSAMSLMTYSMPNVLDSSTASSSFSWSISNDEYGGKSSLLKQV